MLSPVMFLIAPDSCHVPFGSRGARGAMQAVASVRARARRARLWKGVNPAGSARRARRLEAQQRTVRLVGQQIDEAVGSLAHLANTLLELGQQDVPPDRQPVRAEDDALHLLTNQP